MADLLVGGELLLYGTVGKGLILGPDGIEEDGFDAIDVQRALAEHGRNKALTVHINSGGGIATDGIAIYNALAAHRGKVNVVVDGIAASAASLIAMAGKTITMRTGSLMLIHDPSGSVQGPPAELRTALAWLESLAASLADIYAERTGRALPDVRADMAADTLLTADEAVALGYADRVDTRASVAVAAFDYRRYRDAPAELVALAVSNDWRVSRTDDDTHRQQEVSMPSKNEPGAAGTETETADIAALRAEIDALKAENATLKTAKAEDDGKVRNEEHAAIARMALAAGVPSMTEALILGGVKPADAQARIDSAKDIKAAVDLARKSCPAIEATVADTFIAAGASVETVRAALFEKMANASPEITARHDNGSLTAGKGNQDTAAVAAGWAKAAAATNARFGRA